VVGLVLLLAALGMASWSVARLLRDSSGAPAAVNQPSAAGHALAMAALFALVSQAVHAFFDYGLYLPPNMLLLAVYCGSAAAVSQQARRVTSPSVGHASVAALVLVVLCSLLGLGIYLWQDLRSLSAVRATLDVTEYVMGLGGATDQELESAIARLRTHLTDRPDDAEMWYQWAMLHIHRYRLARLAALRVATPPEISIETLWERASPAWFMAREEIRWEEESVPDSPAARAWLQDAHAALTESRRACPVLAKTHLRIAPLSAFVAGRQAGEDDLARAVRCEPSNTFYLAEAGRLHFLAGRQDEALRLWRRSLSVRPEYLAAIRRWVGDLPPRELVYGAFPTDPRQLIALATERLSGDADAELHDLTLAFAIEQLDGLADVGTRAGLHGRILALQGQLPEAIRQLVIAVEAAPGDASWHYELGVLLYRYGRADDAREQARIAVSLDPDHRLYRRFLDRLLAER
jgi:tetratricopeptide (TPR) repeat protein